MSQMSPTLPTRPLLSPQKKSLMDRETIRDFFTGDASTVPSKLAPEIFGACGLPVEPLEPTVIREWEAEIETETDDPQLPIGIPKIGGVGQAELSGFEDEERSAVGKRLLRIRKKTSSTISMTSTKTTLTMISMTISKKSWMMITRSKSKMRSVPSLG